MRALTIYLAGCFILPAVAQTNDLWFTLMGTLADGHTDTVQLNMSRISKAEHIESMELRVSLGERRTNGSEVYQSYWSTIEIDCANSSIVHVEQRRYEGPRWTGAETFQRFTETRPMAFTGLQPNPKERVLKAACR